MGLFDPAELNAGDYGGGGDKASSTFGIGTGFSAAGDLISGFGALIAGNATADADRAKVRADEFSAHGYELESQAYTEAAGYAQGNVNLAEENTAIQQYQEQLKIQRSIGKQEATIAGSGFSESGSALSLLKSSASQGALAQGLIGVQGAITAESYMAQKAADVGLSEQALSAEQAAQAAAQAERDAASSASTGGFLGLLGGVAKAGAALVPLLL